jgi:flagellar hook protein FlgE
MGLYNMMITSASGMAAQTNWLGTISDNIANSKTTGYKNAGAEFSTLVVSGGTGEYTSGGVATHARYDIMRQGVLDYTTSTTDLSIQGNGFFVVSDSEGNNFLTRAGSFVSAADGTLVNAGGYKLMGYEISGGSPITTLSEVNTASLALQAQLSTAGTLTLNLPSDYDIPSTALVDPNDPSSGIDSAKLPSQNPSTAYYTKKTSMTAYGDLGKVVTLDVYVTKVATGTWEFTVFDHAYANPDPVATSSFPYADYSVDPATAVAPLVTTSPNAATPGAGDITFDASTGRITSANTSLSIPVSADLTKPITLDLSSSTQLAAPWSVINSTIDGHAASAFDHLSVSTQGDISAVYANGVQQSVYQVPLANVASPNNLTVCSSNVFQPNANSGNVYYDTAGTAGFGDIISGALEGSTADIATELTKMIVAQRNFTANSSVFKTGSELMDVLNNLVR